MTPSIEPLYATGIFAVSRRLEIYQVVTFEYIDLERYYASLSENIEELDEEMGRLAVSMQNFLDSEDVILNGEKVRPKVLGVDLSFKEPEEPCIVYFIYFSGRPRKGVNYYENIYEGVAAEYPHIAYWYFPPGARIKSVDASGTVEVIGTNILIIRVVEGERISGYERIEFLL